jgi:hypothetical protein
MLGVEPTSSFANAPVSADAVMHIDAGKEQIDTRAQALNATLNDQRSHHHHRLQLPYQER